MAEYCLRWNNHQPNLVTVFSELLNAETLVDVTLATDGHFIHAHKLVLSACSVYFKDLFGSNPCKHPIVFLKDIKIEDLKTVIDFIYRGEVNVSQERLQDVLKTAESLRIKGLADKPFSYDEYPSQSRGGGQQHLSSSFSSQRSSLTDSREQQQSGDADDLIDVSGGDGHSPPAHKKRKVASSQDSSDGAQETNHEEDRSKSNGKEENVQSQKSSSSSAPTVNDEGGTTNTTTTTTTPKNSSGSSAKEKQKDDKEVTAIPVTSESRPEFQESRAADAMLMLQGSSSDGGEDGGSGSGGGTIALSNTSSRTGDSSSLMGSHSQGFPGRPSHNRQQHHHHHHHHHQNAVSHLTGSGSNSQRQERGGSPSRKMVVDPYLYTNCLIIHPKLKASDGSHVTIRTGTAENFLQAVEDIREGKMGFCKAGKIYGVNHATLQKFYKAMGYSIRNRSNNPNFVKSDSASERGEESHDLSTHSSVSQEMDPLSYGGPYSSPKAFYQHFLTPHSDLENIYGNGRFSSVSEGQRNGTSRMTLTTVPSSTSSSNQRGLRPGSPCCSMDILSNRLDAYSSSRLMNYSSLYCEAIDLAEDSDKPQPHQLLQQQLHEHLQETPVASSNTSSNNNNANSIRSSENNTLDVNHPIVLCNL